MLVAAGLLAAAPAPAAPVALPDTTLAEAWKLPNGLRVTMRDVPRATTIAITLAVPVGSAYDPPDRPGLARLAGEVAMMSEAGDVPERTRDEMESLRPLGWSLTVTPRATRLSEIATRATFPVVLRQLAARLRGLHPSETVVHTALDNVRRDTGYELFGQVSTSLYSQVRAYAGGADEHTLPERAALRALSGVTARELETRLNHEFTPANAVLAIAGDVSGFDVRALVTNECGALPAGDPLALPEPAPLRPSVHTGSRADITRPEGIVGIIAPALSDTLHPYFYISMLLLGQHFLNTWPPDPAVGTRFSYSILDEPDLVRICPAMPADSTQVGTFALQIGGAVAHLLEMIVDPREYLRLRDNVMWLLGGPLPHRVLENVRTDPAALNTLCNSMASRELTGGEAFWAQYRQRFDLRRNPQLPHWGNYLARPEHQVVLLFTPRK